MTIGVKIKVLRKKLNWTAQTLADKTNIHPVSIRKYETNKVMPQEYNLNKIADVLNVIPEMLIDDECDVTTKETIEEWCDKQINKYQKIKDNIKN